MEIALIGRGRVATHLEKALQTAGHIIHPLGGRNRKPIPSGTQIIILSINDDSIAEVSRDVRTQSGPDALIVHTSGSKPLNSIPGQHRGVLYPLQTFTKGRDLDFREIPLFLEAEDPADMQLLTDIAQSISTHTMPLDSVQRKKLHLAAVFCCNFVNHLYTLSSDILSSENIPFEYLLPLIDETAAKVHQISPRQAQTGPAVRKDQSVIQTHLALLADKPHHQKIYRILTQSIELINT